MMVEIRHIFILVLIGLYNMHVSFAGIIYILRKSYAIGFWI